MSIPTVAYLPRRPWRSPDLSLPRFMTGRSAAANRDEHQGDLPALFHHVGQGEDRVNNTLNIDIQNPLRPVGCLEPDVSAETPALAKTNSRGWQPFLSPPWQVGHNISAFLSTKAPKLRRGLLPGQSGSSRPDKAKDAGAAYLCAKASRCH